MEHPFPDSDLPAPGPSRDGVRWGVLLWAAFAIVAVALRGVRWDENFDYLQSMLDYVPYPAGHPRDHLLDNFFTLQVWWLAPVMKLTSGRPLLPNAMSNVLSLMATVIPPFLMGTALTRRVIWGHVSAVLLLVGTHVLVFSTYPVNTWPYEYSNGHVGTGYVVLTLAILLLGRRRTFFFLVGLMPAVHLGQFPAVLGFTAVYIAWNAWKGDRRKILADALWILAGLVPSLALWSFAQSRAVPPASSGPYYHPIDAELVRVRYQEHHASHRMLPWNTGHFGMVAFLLLTWARAWLARARNAGPAPWVWLGIYGAITAAIVWSIAAIHYVLDPEVPYLLLAWMPYRLPNHLTTLLVPAALATAIGWPEADARRWIAVGSAGLAAVLALTAGPLQIARVTMGLLLQIPYTESILFALFGAAAASTLLDVLNLRRWVVPWSALWGGAVLGAALGFRGCLVSSVGEPYQAGWAHYPWLLLPASLLIGFILAVALEGRRFPGAGSKIAGVLCVVAVAIPTVQEWNRRDHLPVSEFERRIVEHLAERGEGPVMILAPHQQQSLQTRLGQPVMTDMGGFNWIPYKPSVGPSHYKMYLDLFGINFAPGPGEPAYPGPHWSAFPERYVWGPRPRAEWQRLGEEYDIDYVISPSAVPLDLPRVLEGGGFAFYRIPDADGSGS